MARKLENTRRRARSSHQAARAHERDARGGRLVGQASLKRGLSLTKILLPPQRVANSLRLDFALTPHTRWMRAAVRGTWLMGRQA